VLRTATPSFAAPPEETANRDVSDDGDDRAEDEPPPPREGRRASGQGRGRGAVGAAIGYDLSIILLDN
jgi:hypothetical protein